MSSNFGNCKMILIQKFNFSKENLDNSIKYNLKINNNSNKQNIKIIVNNNTHNNNNKIYSILIKCNRIKNLLQNK